VSKSVANLLSDKDGRLAASVAFFRDNRRHYPWNVLRVDSLCRPGSSTGPNN